MSGCKECKKVQAQANKNWKQSRYAWGQFYELQERFFELQTEIYDQMNEVGGEDMNTNHNETQAFLNNFIKDLYKKAKEECECSVCMEQIHYEDLDTTPCGHTFHKGCITQLKTLNGYTKQSGRWTNHYYDCPVCRKPISYKP
jgi:hypothetical protein